MNKKQIEFNLWLDNEILNISKNKEIIAINFNIYECIDNVFTLEIIWTNYFYTSDPDWACYDIYSSNNEYYINWNWKNWKEILVETKNNILNYIEYWKFKSIFIKYNIWFGFVDWDIEIINQISKN